MIGIYLTSVALASLTPCAVSVFATSERYRPAPPGWFRRRPGFKLPPMMFTDEEALALALGLLAGLSFKFAVRRPPELREALRRHAAEVSALAECV